jgi:hypothetical protein
MNKCKINIEVSAYSEGRFIGETNLKHLIFQMENIGGKFISSNMIKGDLSRPIYFVAEFEFDSKVESPLYDFTLNWITK